MSSNVCHLSIRALGFCAARGFRAEWWPSRTSLSVNYLTQIGQRSLTWCLNRFGRGDVASELGAGLSLAAVGLPAVLGYSTIAHMPISTGLYTFLLPVLAFALVGSSRHLIVAGDSATAALLAAGLAGLAPAASAHYVGLAMAVSLIVGGLLLLVRVLRLGFVANFLSRTILVGFLAGVGIQVTLSQLPALLGLHLQSSSAIGNLWNVASHFSAISWPDAIIGAAGVGALWATKLLPRRTPGGFIVTALGIAVGWWAVREHWRVSFIAPVRPGLPHFGVPGICFTPFSRIVEVALSIVVVVVAQSAATSRAFAERFHETVDENLDIMGLALANVASGLSGAYPVNASPTRASMVVEAGGTTQWPGIVAAGVTVLSLLFLTDPLHYLPNALLAAVVCSVAIRLIDLRELRRIYKLRRDEFVVAALAATSVVLLGVENGILLSALMAVVNHLRRGYAPTNFLVVLNDNDTWANQPLSSRAMIRPGVFVYRFQASLWYANVTRLVDEVTTLVGKDTTLFCFDFTSVASVDYSAGVRLAQLVSDLKDRGVKVRFTHVDESVRQQLVSYGVVGPKSKKVIRSTRRAVAPKANDSGPTK